MKLNTKFLSLLAVTAMVVPAMGQTVYFGGTVNNGDFETGATVTPFDGIASSHSTGVVADHTTGLTTGGVMAVDLTANNGEGQWKLLHSSANAGPGFVADVEADVLAGLAFSAEMWVYVPASAGLGTSEVATAQIKLEPSSDGGTTYVNGGALATQVSIDLTGPGNRDVWRKVSFDKVLLPGGTTHVRTRAWLVATVAEVNGLAADGGADGSGGVGPATSTDWNAAGYSGFIYFDDFRLESVLPPDPNILMCEDIANADLETGNLTPWSLDAGAGSIATSPDPVHSGTYALGFDVAVGTDNNQWKQFNNVVSGPVSEGDRIDGQVWVYVPSTTTFDPSRARFNFTIRSDKDTAGNGSLGNFRVNLLTSPTDVWFPYTFQAVAAAGTTGTITSINTGGWHLETQNKDHVGAGNYGGLVYLDDFKLINIGPAIPGVLVDASTFNGDMEAPAVTPWAVSGAGSVSTDQNHTVGGSQSIKVDLTENNSNSQWKGLHGANISHPIETYQKADITGWVYIPSEVNGTKFGGAANLNFPIRDGNAAMPGGPSLDLTTAARDTWVKIEALDIDVSAHTTSLAINNWNIETVALLGPMGSTIRSDGRDGSADSTDMDNPPVIGTSDLDGPPTAADWIAEGYEGCIYFDDIAVRLHTVFVPPPLVINSISRDGVTGDVTINYDSTFIDGADVFVSDNGLADWTFLTFSNGTGTNQDFIDPSPASTDRLYILAEPGTTPPDPTP